MKHTRHLINGLVAGTVALALASTAMAQSAIDSTLKVVRMKGPARYTTGNNVWQPLRVGAVVHPGTVIQTSTEKGSFVDLSTGEVSEGSTPATGGYQIYIPNS